MELRGKMALVTGGAVRIGRAICEALAREGANVIVHYGTSEREAGELCEELRAKGVTAKAVRADLADPADLQRLLPAAGPVDVLVNSAAVFHKDRIGDVTAEKLLGEFWPNLFAPILLTRAFAAQGPAAEGRVARDRLAVQAWQLRQMVAAPAPAAADRDTNEP